jgi:hypothetical protein
LFSHSTGGRCRQLLGDPGGQGRSLTSTLSLVALGLVTAAAGFVPVVVLGRAHRRDDRR